MPNTVISLQTAKNKITLRLSVKNIVALWKNSYRFPPARTNKDQRFKTLGKRKKHLSKKEKHRKFSNDIPFNPTGNGFLYDANFFNPFGA